MSQTTNGSMVVASKNLTTMNNQGALTLTSGGSPPQQILVDAGADQPTVLVHNWRANNLKVTNTSFNDQTPIAVEALGPGIPGQAPKDLLQGTPLTLAVMDSGEGPAAPNWTQLKLSLSGAALAVFAVIGGPVDASCNNAYVIAVNAQSKTGPNTGSPPPPGYYATTTDNYYTFQFNWGGAQLYVAYLGSATVDTVAGVAGSPPATVTLLFL